MLPVNDENPRRGPAPINIIIIILNFIVFVLQVFYGESFVLDWAFTPARLSAFLSGNASPLVILTIFSAMFMHGSIAHILGNMLFLWIFGDNVEDQFGHLRYLAFYLFCGIAATFTQYGIDPGSPVPNLGASGAIAGVLGAYLLMFPRVRVNLFVWPLSVLLAIFTRSPYLRIPAWLMLGLWFAMQLLLGVEGLSNMGEGGVAFWAHIGGFIAGLVLTFVLRGFTRTAGAPAASRRSLMR
jgi:membrane associated rhomboid family serine protease